jgi:hypothetical protein
MGMKLTSDMLTTIAATVNSIEEAQLDVKVVRVLGHDVHLQRTEDQREGATYYVVGISNNGGTGATR